MSPSRAGRGREARPSIPELVLVSSSPRRRELLGQLGLPFTIEHPEVDETVGEAMSPSDYVRLVARRKLDAHLAHRPGGGRAWALAADTVVALGQEIIGKPGDRAEAERVLRALSGKAHRVITGLALYVPNRDAVVEETATTTVVFSELSEEEVAWYLSSGEWQGVAGGYRIQERGAVLVERIDGSYSNVVGLPIETFYGMVQDQGYTLFPPGE